VRTVRVGLGQGRCSAAQRGAGEPILPSVDDNWRAQARSLRSAKLGGPLDDVVWTEIVRLLEDPRLIQNELERRLMAAREADPTKRRDEALRRDLVRIRKAIDRLLTAYQEGLLPIDELRERMPELRRREQASNAELRAIADQSVTRAAYLRLAETLNTFLTRLRSSAGALDVSERQRIMRLLVKEVLVGDDKIIIRHCIPLPNRSGDGPPDGA
jgi:site-specific DNA recombinase